MSDDSASQEVLPPQSRAPGAADTPLGAYTRPDRGLVAADIVAIALTGLWLLGVAIYFLFLRPSGQESTQSGLILSMLAIFLPIALIWIGSTVAKTAAIMRQEAARLQGAIDAMRNAYIQQSQLPSAALPPGFEKKLDSIVASQKQTETTIATFATSRQARLPAQSEAQPALIQPGVAQGDSQPGLALGTPPESLAPALSVGDFVGALNFPENENDAEGFRQLRRALSDPNSGKLVRASQDVLTLLSQDGIYMDDLRPDRSRPELWRKFAAGQRGHEISGIGGIHDRSGLALASGRMRSDPIFRDAVHHFLRQFDKTFAKFADQASDDDIIRLSDTRTARAFMLLGRVAGTFD
ncbi:MAG: hypothetical protein AAF700_05385 [Pseudomonadota bacterium]